MKLQKFRAKVQTNGSRVTIPIPFDPNSVWGAKQRHYVTGSINDVRIRVLLGVDDAGYFLPLGAAWRRDSSVDLTQTVTVILEPEGPQQAALAEDIATALAAQPEARAFFDSLATFYRKGYVQWIEGAKRPETRVARIAEMVALLKAGKKQR